MNIRAFLTALAALLYHAAASGGADTPSGARPVREITVSVVMAGQKRRVPIKQDKVVTAAAFGNLHGTNQLELWLNNRLLGSVRSTPRRLEPLFGTPTNTMQGIYSWKPTEPGDYQFIAKVITGTGDTFVSEPLSVAAAELSPPKVILLEKPKEQLLTTDEVNITIQGISPDSEVTTVVLETKRLDLFKATNGPTLMVRGVKLRPGWHEFIAKAVDENGLISSPQEFACAVDAVERAGSVAPAGLVVEPAVMPGQTRPQNWYPNPPSKNRIAGAPDALQLRWQPPGEGLQAQGTLLQRRAPGETTWRTLAIVPKGLSEWRDAGLRPQHYYLYRIAFLLDEVSRTAYTAGLGEVTSVGTSSYGVIGMGAK
jgi:hypothetical protein